MAGDERRPSVDHEVPETPPTLVEAVHQLGHETRARIVLELGAYSDGPTDLEGLAYAELMERVGAEDSGRFNYHLSELVGGLVAKRENGYWLQVNGHLVYQALVAGTVTGEATVDVDIDRSCGDCDGALRATYRDDQVFVVDCADCDRVHQHLEFPARGVEDRAGEAALTAAARYVNGQYASLRRGVCPRCAARVDAELVRAAEAGGLAELVPDADAFATLACRACSLERIGTPEVVALTTPPAVGFFDEHGVEAHAYPAYAVDDDVASVSVGDGDPPTATVDFRVDGDRLRVTLDASLSVVGSERL